MSSWISGRSQRTVSFGKEAAAPKMNFAGTRFRSAARKTSTRTLTGCCRTRSDDGCGKRIVGNLSLHATCLCRKRPWRWVSDRRWGRGLL